MDEEIDLDALKSYSAPDILICGNCRFLEYTFKFGITNSTLRDAIKKKNRKIWAFCPKFVDPLFPPP